MKVTGISSPLKRSLESVLTGSVVRLPWGTILYLVAHNSSDYQVAGPNERVLVNLENGLCYIYPLDKEVIPVTAEVHVDLEANC